MPLENGRILGRQLKRSGIVDGSSWGRIWKINNWQAESMEARSGKPPKHLKDVAKHLKPVKPDYRGPRTPLNMFCGCGPTNPRPVRLSNEGGFDLAGATAILALCNEFSTYDRDFWFYRELISIRIDLLQFWSLGKRPTMQNLVQPAGTVHLA